MDWLGWDLPTRKIAESVLLIAVILLVRASLIRTILHAAPQSEMRLRWLVTVRNVAFFLIAGGLAAIWASAIATYGAIIVALGVSFVIATKELLQCITGSIVRTVANAYKIGDRIEIGNFRGDVIDWNLFTTTLLEVGPGRAMHLRTGRTLVVPNSKLLDAIVVNESFMKQYVVHNFAVPVNVKDDWKRAEAALLRATNDVAGKYVDLARAYMETLERSHGLSGLPVMPRSTIQMSEPGRITFLIRFPAPVGRQGQLEQEILRKFLEETQTSQQLAHTDTPL